jgi:hypothetical protein
MSTLLEQASLVMIPSGYKEDIVYSQIPTDGSGDLSFTRASNGTRINSAGLVEVTPWNFVEQSSNLGSWSNAGVTITTGITDAYGTTNAVTMSNISSGNNTDYIAEFNNPMDLPGGTVINTSVYLKGSGSIGVAIERGNTGDYFNTSQIFTLTTAWVRYDFAYTMPSGTRNGIHIYITNLTGTTATSVDICFPQINYGSTAKPYFPTTDRLNVPRLTYQNGGGGCPSLLLEKQSTNLALQSQSFISPWAIGNYLGTNPVITQNYGISPDGTQNAVRIQLARTNSNDSYSQVYQYPISVSVGQQYTWSVYLKSLSGTPTISIVGDFGRPPVTLTSEWVRYTGTGTATASQTQLEIAILGSNYATGNSLSADFLAYGYQIEQSSYPTSYIPTTSSSATRVADTYQKAGIGNTSTSGTLYYELVATQVDSPNGQYLIQLFAGSSIGGAFFASGNSIGIYGNGGAIVGYNNGYGQLLFSITPTLGVTVKVALRYDGTNVVAFVNGVKQTVYSDTATGVKNALRVNNGENGSQATKELVFFPIALTDSECIQLTS